MSQRWDPDRLVREGYPGPGLDFTVFYGDLDTNAHINNVAFGRYFEQARVHTHHDSGASELLFGQGFTMLVASVTINYLDEGRYGHPLHVRTRVGAIGTTSVQEQQAAWQDDRCVALADVTIVCTRDHRPAPVPDGAREVLGRLRP